MVCRYTMVFILLFSSIEVCEFHNYQDCMLLVVKEDSTRRCRHYFYYYRGFSEYKDDWNGSRESDLFQMQNTTHICIDNIHTLL